MLFFYHGDVSKLCDLVRQRIVFDSLTDLCWCLEEIGRDALFQVVCLKNRFDTHADVSRTAGYRDVRVCTETTEELGVSGHVCELQLTHREMSLHLSPAQHKRYLGFKNATIFRFYNTSTSLSWGSSRGIIGIYLSRIFGMLNRKMDTRTDLGRGDVDQSLRDTIQRFDASTRRDADRAADEKPLQDCLIRDGVRLGKLFSTSDPELKREMDAAVSRMLRVRWHNVGDFLTRKLQTEGRLAVLRTDTAMLFLTAPSYALHHCTTVIWLLIISAAMISVHASGSLGVLSPISGGLHSRQTFWARHVRFRVLETRWPNASSGMQFGNASTRRRSCTYQEGAYHAGDCSGDTSAGVKALELELDGCPLAMDEAKVSGNRTTRFISFPRPRLANGWALTTLDRADTAPADPVRFLIHVSPGVRKEKIAGKLPADCLVASGWSPSMVAQLGPLEVREQVVKIVKGTGRGWCDNNVCVGMSDAELLQTCLPPWQLDEDDWTLEGASSYAWPPRALSTRALEPKFLPLYTDTRGARYSDSMWNEPQNLDYWRHWHLPS